MEKRSSIHSKKSDHQALQTLVGTVVIAGASYAAKKIMDSRHKKKLAKKDSLIAKSS